MLLVVSEVLWSCNEDVVNALLGCLTAQPGLSSRPLQLVSCEPNRLAVQLTLAPSAKFISAADADSDEMRTVLRCTQR